MQTYVKEMPYARAKNIDFSSANKLRSMKSSTRKLRIYNSRKPRTSSFYFQQLLLTSSPGTASAGAYRAHRHLRKKMDQFYGLCPGVPVHRGNNYCTPLFTSLCLAVAYCWVYCIGSCVPVHEDRTVLCQTQPVQN